MSHAEQLVGLNWVHNLAQRSAGVSLEVAVRPAYQPFFLPPAPSAPPGRPKQAVTSTPPTDSIPDRSPRTQLESPIPTTQVEQAATAGLAPSSLPPAEQSQPVTHPVSFEEPAIEAIPTPTGQSPPVVPVEPAVRPEEPAVALSQHESAAPTVRSSTTGPSESAPPEAPLAPAQAQSLVPAVSGAVTVTGAGKVVPAQTEDRSPAPATKSSMPTIKVESGRTQWDQAPAAVTPERASPEGETLVTSTLVGVKPAAPSVETQSAENALPSTVADSSPTIPPLVRPAPPVQPPDIAVVEATDQPAVQVRIGTVEVRASRPPATSSPRPAPRPQGFERYLHLRGGEMEGLL